MTNDQIYLFIVFIGGKSAKSNIELHDVRWVIGRNIEDTFDQIREGWFGDIKGLHLDSYKKITEIDGHRVTIKKVKKRTYQNKDNIMLQSIRYKRLWFVNLGGYDRNSMSENHEFGLFVANTSEEAKEKAKKNLLTNSLKKHMDNISKLSAFKGIDDCEPIRWIGDWEIELVNDAELSYEKLVPDWFGYLRID